MKKFLHLAAGVLLGLLLAWLLGLFSPTPNSPANVPAPAHVPAVAMEKAVITAVTTTRSTVALPTAAAVPAHGPEPAPARASSTVAATAAPTDQANFDQVRQRSQVKAAVNNLRILGSAAQQYMLEHHTTSVGYYDLVGAGTDNYIRSVNPVVEEDYTGLVIMQDQTQVSISSQVFGTVTYNL